MKENANFELELDQKLDDVFPKAKKEKKSKSSYNIKVTHPNLRIRKGPSTQDEVVGYITDLGTYEIFEEQDGWGQLKDKNWIMLSFTQKVE